MIELIFLFILGLIWILFATIQDWKTREIANWLNFSLLTFALGFRFFYSLFVGDGFNFFYQGVIGLIAFFILGNLLYYAKFFAGGDTKLMVALGPVVGFFPGAIENLLFFTKFLFYFIIFGGIYSLIASLGFSIKYFKNFKKEFLKLVNSNKNKISIMVFLGLILMISGFWDILLFYLGVIIFILPYFYIYAKAVDESCMIKKVNVKKLTEGDWLYSDIKIGNKVIKSNWNGLTKKEISFLQKNKKFVKLRFGIPFTPVFLITYLLLSIPIIF